MIENIIPTGTNTIKAHLEHLRDHKQERYLNEALEVLKQKGIETPMDDKKMTSACTGGCPGAKMMDFSDKEADEAEDGKRYSQLRQWPVQLHLVSPMAPYFQGKDVVISADCVAYSLADFHKDYLKGKSLAIACPKLDSNQDVYVEKIIALIDDAKINTLTIMTMEVPCCGGLVAVAKQASDKAKRKVPIKSIVVGINGDILNSGWI